MGEVRHGRDGTVLVRQVGPGRIERRYRATIHRLERRFERAEVGASEARGARERAERELDLSQRVERGCQRRIDRLETRLDEREAERVRYEQDQKRLILVIGGLQREKELLQSRLAELTGRPLPSLPGRPSSQSADSPDPAPPAGRGAARKKARRRWFSRSS